MFPASLFLTLAGVTFAAPRYHETFRKRQIADGPCPIQWDACPDITIIDPRISCAIVPIPLDYADASAGSGQIFVAKFAAQAEPRLGTLFTNPGGPGGSGVDHILGGGEIMSNRTGGVYDIISWDPRGVGQVTVPSLVQCFSSQEEYNTYFNGSLAAVTPRLDVRGNFTDQSEIEFFLSQVSDFEEKMKGLEQQCLSQESGSFMQYVGTAATVRDMVTLADAIEGPDTPINYWGFSYGTMIGNYFVNMFTERVGRVVLDGVLDPNTHSVDRTDLAWANTVESTDEAFQGFANGCTMAGPEACKLADPAVNGGKDIVSWTQELIGLTYDLIQEGVIPRGRSTDFRALLQTNMFSPQQWGTFANEVLFPISQMIANATAASSAGVNLTEATMNLLKRKEPEALEVPGVGLDSTIPLVDFTFHAISCGDSVDAGGISTEDVFEELLRVTREVSGTFGPQFPQPAHQCHLWPFRAVERYAGPFNATLPNPMLVIGNTADPTTPFKNAKSVADSYGDSATLIEQRGFGHVTLAQRSECTQRILLDYFVNGNRPEGDDTICDVDDTLELFQSSGVTEAMVYANCTGANPAPDVQPPLVVPPLDDSTDFDLCIAQCSTQFPLHSDS